MSMNAITNNQYENVSEMYSKYDVKVSSYYITSGDTYGKPTMKEVIGMYLYKNMEILLFLVLVTLLTGCGGGGGSGDSSMQAVGDSSIQAVESSLPSKAVQKGHITDSLTGEALANVEVSIGSQTVTTDTDGFYTLSGLTETEEAVLNFEKEGYLLGSTKVQIKELAEDNTPSTNYLEYSMYAHDYQWNHDSTEEILSQRIAIDSSLSYVQTKGSPYIGTMAVELTVLDSDEDTLLNNFPGSFEGKNTNGQMVPFVSYGLISLSFKDDKGNALNLTSDTRATLTFNTVPSSEEQNIIPLWYYDYEQGLWIEEGYAELHTDGTYKGDISHSGTWSLNKPIETDPGIYRGRILNEDGSAISDVRLQAIGHNWISNDLSTDEYGVFEIVVIPGEDFKLKAYHYEDKYGAESGIISAVESGEIVEI